MHLDTITKSIGWALIILAFLNFTDFIRLDPLSTMCFSLTAVAFTITDLLETNANKNGKPFKYRKRKEVLYFLGVFSFIAIPYIKIPWDQFIIGKLSNFSTLLSIGLVFVIMGIKQKQIISDTMQAKVNEIVNEQIREYSDNQLPKLVDELMDMDLIKQVVDEKIRARQTDNESKQNTLD
ncbi:hypothetical protein K7T73_06945 [Bacillus badius]|uniref:hypothetical protein n=1 Tax=Bacillus badius TaxID=1455 RepID=UPI001CBD1D8D|nr:hypothetical protein [Bacillus badius]UAT31950.1 hypothetical protein K7T73_06945 [Bacillus badius]